MSEASDGPPRVGPDRGEIDSPNGPKRVPQRSPNAPKMAPKSGPGGSPGGPGRVLRGSRGPSRRPRGCRGGPGGVRGRFWADLGVNLGAFGGPPGATLGLLLGGHFPSLFQYSLGTVLEPFWSPKMGPKGAPKGHRRSFETEGWKSPFLSNPPMVFADFWSRKGSQIGAKSIVFSLQLRIST